MKSNYEINTKTTSKASALMLQSFVDDNMNSNDAYKIILTLQDNGFKFAEDYRSMIKAWGSISNNEIISVNYILMAELPYPEKEVACVRFQYHREEYPGYEMIDHREDYEGGMTWTGFKKRFNIKEGGKDGE